jgi:hypothetical protein
MVQLARPTQDVSDTGWNPQPVSEQVNEAVPNDGTYSSTTDPPSGATVEMQLAGIAYPSAGPQTLTVRLKNTGSSSVPVTVQLLQGGAVIASQTFYPTASFQDYVISLTTDQEAQITNYADLQVVLIEGAAPINCCPGVSLPAVLTATFSNGTGTCSCLNGQTVLLTLGAFGNPNAWGGMMSGGACGSGTVLFLSCSGGTFALTANGPCGFAGQIQGTYTCSPVSIVFAGIGFPPMSCCNGTATITVTI